MSEVIKLSAQQARKIVLLSQGIHKENELGSGRNATLKAIEKLGYIQIDTISVVERAHHHTLWNRANGYQKKHLDQLLAQGEVFEYWSHAAAYLPMRDFRFSLPYKHEIASGSKHWYQVEKKLKNSVLKRVTEEGPLQARDFEQKRTGKDGWGDWKPAKRALEQLFIEGKLMIARRQGFQKVFDLPERVLPDSVDTRMPSSEEFCDHLIFNYLKANALGTPAQIGYLRKGWKSKLAQRCQQLLEDQQLIEVAVGEHSYVARPGALSLTNKQLSRSKVKILSPFDNLLIQRKRTREIFNFDYLIECYVTAAKRQYGYFCLPLLWGQRFAGMVDAKIDRKSGILSLVKLHVHSDELDDFMWALKPGLQSFLAFNGGHSIKIDVLVHQQKKISQPRLNNFTKQMNL